MEKPNSHIDIAPAGNINAEIEHEMPLKNKVTIKYFQSAILNTMNASLSVLPAFSF